MQTKYESIHYHRLLRKYFYLDIFIHMSIYTLSISGPVYRQSVIFCPSRCFLRVTEAISYIEVTIYTYTSRTGKSFAIKYQRRTK